MLVLTNIQTPYSADFYGALRARTPLQVLYAGPPALQGRAWQIPPREWERVALALPAEAQAIWAARGEDLLLSGDYLSARANLRRLVGACARRRFFWGERLSEGSALKQAARRRLFRGFDAIFAVGTWAVDGYRDCVADDVPVHVLPYVRRPAGTERRPAPEPVIGFAGSLVPRKGLDILLMALGAMDDPPRLEVIGSGALERDLRRLAADLHLAVTWHGEVPPDQVGPIRTRWWLQIVPSRYDGWAVVVNEALGSGVPVLTSRMTGAGRDLLDGTCGEVVDDHSWPEALKRWLAVARDPERTQAARTVATALSADAAADWLLDVLRDGGSAERSFITEYRPPNVKLERPPRDGWRGGRG